MTEVDLLPERMQKKIRVEAAHRADVTGPCWTWMGCLNSRGYGCVGTNGKTVLTHRHSYELLVAEIPKGLQIDHLCRNKACCNPQHLEPVTGKINCERTEAATKMRCIHGHALAGPNLLIKQRSNGRYMRNCRICLLDMQQRSRAKAGARTNSTNKKRAELIAASEAALKILRPAPVTVLAPKPERPTLTVVDQPDLFGEPA